MPSRASTKAWAASLSGIGTPLGIRYGEDKRRIRAYQYHEMRVKQGQAMGIAYHLSFGTYVAKT
jgi:hypothetical protein